MPRRYAPRNGQKKTPCNGQERKNYRNGQERKIIYPMTREKKTPCNDGRGEKGVRNDKRRKYSQ